MNILVVYFAAAVLFILGMKRLSSPATARSGNQWAAIGMLIAVIATFADRNIFDYRTVLIGILIGGGLGLLLAYKVKITDMPQMVAIFNGVGGGAAALVETGEFWRQAGAGIPRAALATMLVGMIIGYVSLSGSFIAFGKLQGFIGSSGRSRPFLKILIFMLMAALLGLVGYCLWVQTTFTLFQVIAILAFIFGILFVLPIGGADMPVVISLLNAYTGLSVALAGFVLQNELLIVSGTLVGASGTLLTQLMCKAMNRSLPNVLFGGFKSSSEDPASPEEDSRRAVHQITAEDTSILLTYAKHVVIVPGYGLAVAQAQLLVGQLAGQLEKKGVDVKYAIHPVAGRMPGHMNVLLAEANIPYSKLVEMDDINPQFENTDVVLVIGANDVVNPAARSSPKSPIYGMPILEVDKAQKIIVLKRGMNPGFAGIENELFYNPKTSLLFGDARDSIQKLMTALKNV